MCQNPLSLSGTSRICCSRSMTSQTTASCSQSDSQEDCHFCPTSRENEAFALYVVARCGSNTGGQHLSLTELTTLWFRSQVALAQQCLNSQVRGKAAVFGGGLMGILPSPQIAEHRALADTKNVSKRGSSPHCLLYKQPGPKALSTRFKIAWRG